MEFGYYTVLKIIHIVTVVVGIGTVSLNGLYGAQAKQAGANGGNAVVRANHAVPSSRPRRRRWPSAAPSTTCSPSP